MRYNPHLFGETKNPTRGEEMIQQTILPIKLERMEAKHTGRSGLFLYAEFMKGFGVDKWITQHMPAPRSGRGYAPLPYITTISMTMYGGGTTIEDTKEIREDEPLKEAIGLKRVPSSSAEGDWLRRTAKRSGIEGMEKVNTRIAQKIINKDKRTQYTLIVDPTIIEAEKKDCKTTYLGITGYRPVIAVIKELDIVIACQFKEGNDNGGRLEIIKKSFEAMPEGKKIDKVLLDSEYYTNEVMEYLSEKGVKWAIAADKDSAIKKSIEGIKESEWTAYKTREGASTDREIGAFVHTTNKGKEAFTVITIRWKDRQQNLFGDSYNYHCIATNDTEGAEEDKQQIIWQYNERAYIENNIKEIKGGFGMEQMPTGDFGGNALYFSIGIMTYNLFIAQKYWTMPEAWVNKTIKSIRWLLVEVVGRIIKRSRRVFFKIAATVEKYLIYERMRQRTYALATE
mgnify:CR=1 FL=1